MSQLSFTCNYDPEACKNNPRTALPFLYSEACLALGNKVSSATWLCCSCKGSNTAPGRGTGEAKQQEWAFCQLPVAVWAAWAASCQLKGSRSSGGPWKRAPPAHGRWWRLLPAHSVKSTSEARVQCCPCSMAGRRKPVPKFGSFSAGFALAYLHLQCSIC